MKYYFYYCPRCKYEKVLSEIPLHSIANCRDGYGRPVYHSPCPQCGNLDAGCIWCSLDETILNKPVNLEDEKEYNKHIISLYQNIRTTEPHFKLED